MAKIDFGITDEAAYNSFKGVPEALDFYEQNIREVQLAEQLGFRHYFVVEHQGATVIGQCQSPTVYLSALAQRTSTIRLGAMIFLMPFHDPMRLAQDTAMVDQLSRGRLEFGAGTGVTEHEFPRWNIPFAERRAMSVEALEIVKKAWTEEIVTYKGNYWNYDEALPLPRPYQKPHPPIWWGGSSIESLEYAAAHNYNISMALDLDSTVIEAFDTWRRLWREAEHKGPMPRALLSRSVYVAETDEQAKEEVAPYLVQAYTYGVDKLNRKGFGAQPIDRRSDNDNDPDRIRRRKTEMFQGMAADVDFWLEHGLAHVGSPETVIKRLEKQQQLTGFDVFTGRFRWADIPDELVEKSMRLFGEKVIPAFS